MQASGSVHQVSASALYSASAPVPESSDWLVPAACPLLEPDVEGVTHRPPPLQATQLRRVWFLNADGSGNTRPQSCLMDTGTSGNPSAGSQLPLEVFRMAGMSPSVLFMAHVFWKAGCGFQSRMLQAGRKRMCRGWGRHRNDA